MIDQARKDGIVAMEFGTFIRQMGAVQAFRQERYTYNGQQCTFYKDKADGDAREKVTAGKLAVRTIVDRGFDLPPDLRMYCTANYEVQNRAFNKDANWNDVSWITLGTTALAGGRLDATSNMNIPGFTKGAITCIHETGHVLHAHARGDDFHDPNANLTGPAPAVAGQVSGYAQQNKKEFVAEVFAGLMIGRHFPNAVMTVYMDYGGPH